MVQCKNGCCRYIRVAQRLHLFISRVSLALATICQDMVYIHIYQVPHEGKCHVNIMHIDSGGWVFL